MRTHIDNSYRSDKQDDLRPSSEIGNKRRFHEIEENRSTNYKLNSIEISKKNKKNGTITEINNVHTNVNNSINDKNDNIQDIDYYHNVDVGKTEEEIKTKRRRKRQNRDQQRHRQKERNASNNTNAMI